MALQIKPASECTFDQVSLGEILIRVDPRENRIAEMHDGSFCFGGGEFNTSVGDGRLDLRTAVCTAIVNNRIGQNLLGFVRRNRVDTRFVILRQDDGVGRDCRNGLYYAERGFGVRGAVADFDRANTAASQLKPGDFDWEHIFGELGVRWFHTGGIFAGISATTAPLIIEAVQAAKKHGTIVSYDLNYRKSLWQSIGGKDRAREVNREVARHVDVMLGNEEDYGACLGFEVEGLDPDMTNIETAAFQRMIEKVAAAYPNLKVAATTLRRVATASNNDWSAILWHDGRFFESRQYPGLEIFDRIGGGDGFASGLQFGFLEFNDPQQAVDWGTALGAFNSTTPGDTCMATRGEVAKLVKGESPRIQR